MSKDTVIVLDFGAQYNQLIARRVRECNVYCVLLPYNTPISKIKAMRPKAIIMTGGPASVSKRGSLKCDPRVFGLGVPILGICYGMQLMGHFLGGKVGQTKKREYGHAELIIDKKEKFLSGLNRKEKAWMSHGDQVVKLPKGFVKIAHTKNSKIASMCNLERKRKIIGREFIRVFEVGAKRLGKIKFLAQGTLYPVVIESVSASGGPSATIKTHHNVGGLPGKMGFRLIEPLKDLFKDEVRRLGKELGLSDKLVYRQPFPGPGLAVRIVGEVTKERLAVLREADAIVQEEMKKYAGYKGIWQSFAVLLPVKSVGVMGDKRTYENTVALRAVTSLDAMTADWARIPYDILGRISNRIINEVRGINRVVYDISSKPPSTIEWE